MQFRLDACKSLSELLLIPPVKNENQVGLLQGSRVGDGGPMRGKVDAEVCGSLARGAGTGPVRGRVATGRRHLTVGTKFAKEFRSERAPANIAVANEHDAARVCEGRRCASALAGSKEPPLLKCIE